MIPELLPNEIFEEQEGVVKNLYSISVAIIEASQVKWQNIQTRVYVKFAKISKYSKVKESSERPYYNEVSRISITGVPTVLAE